MIETLAVERQRGTIAEPARRFDKIALLDTADFRRCARRELADDFLQRVESAGAFGDERAIDTVLPQQQMKHAVEERDVAAGLDGQM